MELENDLDRLFRSPFQEPGAEILHEVSIEHHVHHFTPAASLTEVSQIGAEEAQGLLGH